MSDSAGTEKRGPLLSTVGETLAELKIGRAKLYSLLNNGEIESLVIGNRRKIVEESKQAYLQRRIEAERARRSAGLKMNDRVTASRERQRRSDLTPQTAA